MSGVVMLRSFFMKEDIIMSRYVTNTASGLDAAYGFDHAMGYFVQVFDDEGELIVDEDSLFTGLNNGKMLTLIQEHGIEVEPGHLDMIGYDLPF